MSGRKERSILVIEQTVAIVNTSDDMHRDALIEFLALGGRTALMRRRLWRRRELHPVETSPHQTSDGGEELQLPSSSTSSYGRDSQGVRESNGWKMDD